MTPSRMVAAIGKFVNIMTGTNQVACLSISIIAAPSFVACQPHPVAKEDVNVSQSANLNPIEQLFARLKSFLRKMKARTVEELWTAIASFLKGVSKEECHAYLANSDTPNLIEKCSRCRKSKKVRNGTFRLHRLCNVRTPFEAFYNG
jgi:hypothetical protein